jgi:uncharacterized ferredoxin-like protein
MPKRTKKENPSKEQVIIEITCFYEVHKHSPRLSDTKHLTFSKQHINILFGSWNKMLEAAKLPLNRSKSVTVSCSNCGKNIIRQIKELKKVIRSFCTSKCNQQFYRSAGMYKHSNETKNKISKSLKLHRIFKDK